MPKKLKRIGIFGGSFDPPHIGHLIIAEIASTTLGLDVVFLVPAYQPPHKSGSHPTTARERRAMTKLLVDRNPALRVSDIELRRKGVSYTVDTVKGFRRRYPSAELFLILGGDSLAQFHQWKQPGEIVSNVSLVIYRRPGSGRRARHFPSSQTYILKGPMMKLSSSDIRLMVQRRKDIRFLVPDNVRQYINNRRLYL